MANQWVVLQTSTNHDDATFGPFGSPEEADAARADLAGADHLHEFSVLQVQDFPEPEEASEEEVEEAPVEEEEEPE